MKMSLNELKVDSYAAQVNKNELTNVKGGSTPVCGSAVLALAAIVVNLIQEDPEPTPAPAPPQSCPLQS